VCQNDHCITSDVNKDLGPKAKDRYGILEFNVPLDTVYVISETTTLSSDEHPPFSNGGPAT